MKIRQLTQGAIIAALYLLLTLLPAFLPVPGGFTFGPVQVRFSEALTVLPCLCPAAVPGLACGCFLANLIGGACGLGGGILDLVLGTLATGAAAWLSSRMKSDWLVPLPPVLLNAFLVPIALSAASGINYWFCVLTVGAGQLVACYGFGLPLLKVLRKRNIFR